MSIKYIIIQHTFFIVVLLSRKPDGKPLWEYFFYYDTGFGWVYGTAGITGVLLLIILVIMVLCSLPCVRRKGYFEVRTYIVSIESMHRHTGRPPGNGFAP